MLSTIHLSLCVHTCSSYTLSYYLSIHPSIHPSIYLSIYLSIHPSIHPSIDLSIYLSIYLSICVCVYYSVHTRVLKTQTSGHPKPVRQAMAEGPSEGVKVPAGCRELVKQCGLGFRASGFRVYSFGFNIKAKY